MAKKGGRPPKYDWHNARLDLEAGMPPGYVHKKYNVPYDTINKHLDRNPLIVSQEANAVITGFDEVSQQVSRLKYESPELAQRTLDIVKEKHPEFEKAMVSASAKLFNRIIKLSGDATATEVPKLAKGMQTLTDTLGVSQRHAPKRELTNTNAQQEIIPRKLSDFYETDA